MPLHHWYYHGTPNQDKKQGLYSWILIILNAGMGDITVIIAKLIEVPFNFKSSYQVEFNWLFE